MKCFLQFVLKCVIVVQGFWSLFLGILSIIAIGCAFSTPFTFRDCLVFVFFIFSLSLVWYGSRVTRSLRKRFDAHARNSLVAILFGSGVFHSLWLHSKWYRGNQSGYLFTVEVRVIGTLLFGVLIALVFIIHGISRQKHGRDK